MMTELDHLKFPIGKFSHPGMYSVSLLNSFINDIAVFPQQLKHEVTHLSDEQLDTAYRPDGWSIRQVVHHCADSHINSYTRFKLTLTETTPVIKPYWEDRWAELNDSRSMPISPSIQLLEGLHTRWTVLLRSLSAEDYERSFIHPEHGKEISLWENVATYSWHGKHHLAHITHLKQRLAW